MPTHVRLAYKILGSEHVYTSPDLKGLHVSADTHAEAQRAVIAMLDAIADEFGKPHPTFSFEDWAAAA